MPRDLILCVDDEAVILLSLRQEFRRAFRDRFLVETALDAEEAEVVLAELPARDARLVLVLSDWYLPGVRGDLFLADIVRRFPGAGTVLVSGNVDEAEVERSRAAHGISAFLPKPWRLEQLVELVERLCPPAPPAGGAGAGT